MTIEKQTEFLRLVNNEPLVLAVSALSDFLWDDFVRETRPSVTYLINQYDFVQLSRFGKELFDYLYNGEVTTPLITFDALENYFRQKQNGDPVTFPEGYKPENSLWYGLFADVISSPAWEYILGLSVGDQFTSGNNAVNILNEISELLEDYIESNKIDVQLIASGGDKLRKLREEFTQAKERGDDQAAAELRKQGKELGAAIEKAVDSVKAELQTEISKAMEGVREDAQELKEAMDSLAGNQEGVGGHGDDLAAKKKLAKKLAHNPSMKQFIQKLGALRRAWNDRKRAKRAESNYSDIVGASFTDDVIHTFPSELALAATEQGKALFALKYSQKTLLTKNYEAKVKDISKGPVVMYVDISGSMAGSAELWSKAIAYTVAEECLKEKRDVQIHLFDTKVQKTVDLAAGDPSNAEELLNFILTWVTHGGTSFAEVINHALTKAAIDYKTDVLMITDGDATVPDAFIRRLNRFKEDRDLQWNSFCIGTKAKALKEFSDNVQLVDILNDPSSAGLFQDALR
jgi:uncharacterized protein with von Willebrand factor type A (vWA) domain